LLSYLACVLAYGQTASGKTYTMKGNDGNQGIIPLTLYHLFSTIEEKNLIAEIRISYIEIYNENIIDLLNSVENYLEIREDCRKNITILGLNEIKVTKME
jgi:centromeric protein E